MELEPLSDLEERILRTVELVASLRRENEELRNQLEEARSHASSAAQELDSLRNERKQVRTRIEKLLGQMDLLGTS
jgi:FtsZ-binding cell division protein ZapB